MGHRDDRHLAKAALSALGAALLCLALAPSALALSLHAHIPTLDVEGLDHPCGAAVDSKGDLYLSSAGESKINIYSTVTEPSPPNKPKHEFLTSIEDSHEPCSLAVTTTGDLYVSEKATGKVIRFRPNAYPPTASTTYTETTIDASGNAKGIAVDRADNRLYVAEGTKVAVYKADGSFETNVGEGAGLTEATGVAAYTYPAPSSNTDRYLWVADAKGLEADRLDLFSGPSVGGLKLRRELTGASTPNGSFGFGSAGAYLAEDPGNRTAQSSEAKCTPVSYAPVGEQACTAGHLFLYDAAHEALDEFDATGEYLDQTKINAFTDAEPSAIAIDRSGGAADGTIYLTVHSPTGDKALAFSPLGAPSRAPLGLPISKVLSSAVAVATDSHGYVYVAAGSQVHVYKPDGTGLGAIVINAGNPEEKGLFEDKQKPWDLAVDSTGKVYVLDREAEGKEEDVTYYTPSAYPPVAGTTYARHEPLIATPEDFPNGNKTLMAIAVDPGPGPGRDRLIVTSLFVTHLYKSAANGSTLLDGEFAKVLPSSALRQSVAVNGANGNVYIGANLFAPLIAVLSPDGKEELARIDETGGPKGPGGLNPYVAVDQTNGHVLEYDGAKSTAREYDASGSFVAEFGTFTEHVTRLYRVAIDSACALHEPPLDETTTPTCHSYDPANGTAYVAWDDTNANHPPYDVSAFGPLTYPSVGEPPLAMTGAADEFGPGTATLHGTVNPKGSLLEKCRFEYLTDAEYQENKEAHPGDEEAAFEGAEVKACAESPAQIGEGNAAVPVHAEVEGLANVPYRFRLLTANAGGNGAGKAVLFGPPTIEAKSALPVLYHEATLRAEISPSGLDTEYRFEYLDRQSFEAQGGFEGPATRDTDLGELAAGEAPVLVSAVAPSLTEGTEYLFRAVAKNAYGRTPGPEGTFVTQVRRSGESCPNAEYRFGLSANLPDCRAYELVTPGETNGALVSALVRSNPTDGFNDWLAVPRGAGAGEAFSYGTTTTLPGFEGSGAIDGYRAERGPGAHPAAGWGSELLSPSYVQGGGNGNGANALDGSPDQLYSFWQVKPLYSLEGGLPKGTYLRTPSGFEAAGRGSLGTDLEATSQYVSEGGAHVLFSSGAHLEAKAAPSGTTAVYDRAAGSASAQVVSVKPDGSAFGAGEAASYFGATEDGSAVSFSVGAGTGTLFLHREGETTEIATSPNTFAGISEDGTRVFYVAAASQPAGLFVCDAATGPCAGPGAHPATQIAANSTFVDVSADGSHAIFTSTQALTGSEENENGEHAEAAKHNLYAWDGAAVHFVAILDPEDLDRTGGRSATFLGAWTEAIAAGSTLGFANSPARSTPDGDAFVFQSHAQLSAYDNEGLGEIYRYAPSAPEGERLTCVSCDPTGAPPGGDAVLEGRFSAGLDEKTAIPNLTDDGNTVFFHTPDRLLPEDANEVEDVYEWKAKGTGAPECTRPGGCLALISSGQGEVPSFLYGMSADGHDVFFRTQERLVGMDVAGSPSIYDARVGGGIPEPAPPAPCQGDACQGVGTLPPSLPAPASTGGGEGGGEASPPSSCAKGKHRVKGRCVAAKHHKRHAKKHRANSKRGGKR